MWSSRSTIFVLTPFDEKYQNQQKIYMHFCASSYSYRNIKMLNVLIWKCRSRSRGKIFAMAMFDSICQHLQKTPTNLCVSFHSFRYMNIFNFWPSRSRSRSSRAIVVLTTIDGKCHSIQKTTTYFCSSSHSFRYINICVIQKVGQGHGVQMLQCQRSMANVKIYKSLPHILALALTV